MKRAALTTLAAAVVAVLSLGVLTAPAVAGLINNPTTTSLSVSMPSVTYGQESSISFTASVTSPSATPPGTGPVTVSVGPTTLCSFNLVTGDHGTNSCSISSDALLDASNTPYSVTASFGGNSNYQASDPSAPVSLAVDQQTTTTSLGTISPSEVTYGQESTLTFTAGVSPQISGSPTGVIDVDAGATVLCSIVLPASTCSPSDDPQPASGAAASVTATYLGDANYATSTSTPPQDLTVDQASTGLTLSLSASTVLVGDETTLQATATLTPEFGGSPSGSITVKAGSTTLCVIVLPAPSCSPSDANVLAASGTPYDVTASYPGDTNFTGSTSNSVPLTVNEGNSTTSLTISPPTVDFGDESSVTFSSIVSSGISGSPTGTITVAVGPTTLCTIDVATATTCKIGDTALAASGSPYAIVASYGGDGNFTPSASDPMDLTVQQAKDDHRARRTVLGDLRERGERHVLADRDPRLRRHADRDGHDRHRGDDAVHVHHPFPQQLRRARHGAVRRRLAVCRQRALRRRHQLHRFDLEPPTGPDRRPGVDEHGAHPLVVHRQLRQ